MSQTKQETGNIIIINIKEKADVSQLVIVRLRAIHDFIESKMIIKIRTGHGIPREINRQSQTRTDISEEKTSA